MLGTLAHVAIPNQAPIYMQLGKDTTCSLCATEEQRTQECLFLRAALRQHLVEGELLGAHLHRGPTRYNSGLYGLACSGRAYPENHLRKDQPCLPVSGYITCEDSQRKHANKSNTPLPVGRPWAIRAENNKN